LAAVFVLRETFKSHKIIFFSKQKNHI